MCSSHGVPSGTTSPKNQNARDGCVGNSMQIVGTESSRLLRSMRLLVVVLLLIAAAAGRRRVLWLGLRGGRLVVLLDLDLVLVAAAGALLSGDDSGHLAAIGSLLGDDLGRCLGIAVLEGLVDESATDGTDSKTTSGTHEHGLLVAALLLVSMTAVVISVTVTMTVAIAVTVAATVGVAMAVASRVAIALTTTIATTIAATVTAVLATVASTMSTTVAAAAVFTTETARAIATMLTTVVARSLPLSAAGGLLKIVPALSLLVKEGTPAVRQRGLVGGRLVLRLVVLRRRGRRSVVAVAAITTITTFATVTTLRAVRTILGRGRGRSCSCVSEALEIRVFLTNRHSPHDHHGNHRRGNPQSHDDLHHRGHRSRETLPPSCPYPCPCRCPAPRTPWRSS